MSEKNKILVIDDELEMLLSCKNMLTAFGYNTIGTTDGDECIALIKNEKFDLLLCDLLMPGKDGLEIMKEAHSICPDLPVIIFSAYGTIDRAVTCMKTGAIDFLEKPFDGEHLNILIKKALKFSALESERKNLLKQLEEKYKFENIIGESPVMKNFFRTIASVAESQANILITGESGTGKELVARSIHARSNRQAKPFVPVNCGALPENLFEAELFGYEKGAFTDASKQKIGLIEFANSGTFFLDEVCELPLPMQTKLLRVIQDEKIRRLGGNDLYDIDVRWISATNKNVDEYMQKGLLREDLYYRLNVINLHLPALRERKEDIKLLSDHFLGEFSQKNNKVINGFSDEVMECFINYSWPGNVRELKNVVERAVAFAKEAIITPMELDKRFSPVGKNIQNFGNLTLKQVKDKAVSEMEKKYLSYLLKEFSGNITKISEAAEMTRRNTYRLLQRYGLNPEHFRNHHNNE